MSIGGRSTAGRGGRVVEPRREIVEAGDAAQSWRVVDPPAPVVLEVHDADADTVYVIEPVPAYAGAGAIDTAGARPTDVLTCGPDGVFRPAAQRPRWPASDDIRIAAGPPRDTAPIGAVHIDVADGRVYRNGGSGA